MSVISAVWTGKDGQRASELYPAMERALNVYGADKRACYVDQQVAFGLQQFRTLPEDLFDAQPLWAWDRSFGMVADIRLDNRADLVRELSLAQPQSLADSAILMAAWSRWGAACLDRLVGGFAFAVWIPARQELFAARDHTGERPLFYYRGPDFFALASMTRALRVLPDVPQRFNHTHIATWLAALKQEQPSSFFESIQPIPAGHFLRITPGGLECCQYWHPSDAKPIRYRKDHEYAEALVDILDTAVEARLRSAHPVGSFLSSGLDSSAVTSSAGLLLNRQGKRLTAFTSVPRRGFHGMSPPGYIADESEGAAELAGMYPNIDHVLVSSEGYDLLATMKRWVDVLDEPIPNVTNLLWCTAILEQARHQGIQVMLEGADGNGTLSWYTWSILGHFFSHGRWLKLARTARALHGHGALSYKTALRFATRPLVPNWLTRALISEDKQVGMYDRLIRPEWMQRFSIRERVFDAVYHRPLDLAEEHSVLFGIYDRAPFRVAAQALTGIDLRDPTADRRVYEFCFGIPPEQYVAEGQARSLVRRAIKGRVPDSVRLRYTRGLQGADWYIAMTEALPELFTEVALDEQSPAAREALDVPAIRSLLENWPTGDYHKPGVFRRWEQGLIPAICLGYFLRSQEAMANESVSPARIAVK